MAGKNIVKELAEFGMKEMDEMAEVSDATGQFRILLMDQINRVREMEKAKERKNFTELAKIRIGIIPGDGIGPAITEQAVRVLSMLLSEELKSGKVELIRIEGLTLERRLELMEAVPPDVMKEVKTCDVLLKGPTTTPKGGNMESANVALRKSLDLYANVRPVQVPEEGINWVFFRENTEGEYALGGQGIELPGKLAVDFKVTTDAGTRRIARSAYDYAVANGMTNVEIVTKANILKKTDGNFSRICHEVAADYPSLKLEDWYIDIMTAKLLDKNRRSGFQVFVLPNLYGDIITDEAAEIQGGVGTGGSSNIGDQYAMFEAIHGSAVRMVEEGREAYANPASMIKAASMLIRHIGFSEKADKLDRVLEEVANGPDKVVITGRENGATGEAFTDAVLDRL